MGKKEFCAHRDQTRFLVVLETQFNEAPAGSTGVCLELRDSVAVQGQT